MTANASLLPGLSKEIRALLPVWIACTSAVGADVLLGDTTLRGIGVLAYGLGSVALGAQSIGHEYAYRTLGVLLSQPSERRRILLTKLMVLTSMILVLSAFAWGLLPADGERSRASLWHPAALYLAAACGLFVAPWLTMVTRNALAGVVFTVAAAGVLMVAGDLIGVARYGFSGSAAAIDAFKMTFFSGGMAALCAVGAASGWRMS